MRSNFHLNWAIANTNKDNSGKEEVSQKTILCYGDSNTWGSIPTNDHSSIKLRYPRNQRWTGILQILSGNNYYIIEEGLNSRTTNIDYFPLPDRNGKTYLSPCLYSHAPIDLIILKLGSNDMKTYFNRSSLDIKHGLAELIDIIQLSSYGKNLREAPQILIATSPIPLSFVEEFTDENGIMFLKGIVKKARELVILYEELACEKNCHFVDISKTILPSKTDGIHYNLEYHEKLAKIIYKKIKEIF